MEAASVESIGSREHDDDVLDEVMRMDELDANTMLDMMDDVAPPTVAPNTNNATASPPDNALDSSSQPAEEPESMAEIKSSEAMNVDEPVKVKEEPVIVDEVASAANVFNAYNQSHPTETSQSDLKSSPLLEEISDPSTHEKVSVSCSLGSVLYQSRGHCLPDLSQRPLNATLTVFIPRRFLVATHPRVREHFVWGSSPYTDDSDIIAALVHGGHLSLGLSAPPCDLRVTLAVAPCPEITASNGQICVNFNASAPFGYKSRAWAAMSGVGAPVAHEGGAFVISNITWIFTKTRPSIEELQSSLPTINLKENEIQEVAPALLRKRKLKPHRNLSRLPLIQSSDYGLPFLGLMSNLQGELCLKYSKKWTQKFALDLLQSRSLVFVTDSESYVLSCHKDDAQLFDFKLNGRTLCRRLTWNEIEWLPHGLKVRGAIVQKVNLVQFV